MGETVSDLADAIGPREVGGRYYNGYWGKPYTVLAIKPHRDGSMPWSITVEWEDGHSVRRSTHCTPWDPRRDKVLEQPGKVATDR